MKNVFLVVLAIICFIVGCIPTAFSPWSNLVGGIVFITIWVKTLK